MYIHLFKSLLSVFQGIYPEVEFWDHTGILCLAFRGIFILFVNVRLSLCTVMLSIQEYLGPSQGLSPLVGVPKGISPVGGKVVAGQDLGVLLTVVRHRLARIIRGLQAGSSQALRANSDHGQWRGDGESTDLGFCLYWDPRVGLLGPQIITEYQ